MLKYISPCVFMISLISSVGANPVSIEEKPPVCSVEFVIIIPSYNNENYYEDNLESACCQISTNPYQVIYVNDCSTDNTGPLVDKFVKEKNLEHKIKVIHNPERLGSGVANIYNAIHNHVEDHKVVVVIDGDDYFPHQEVLITLEKYYQNPDVWMTHSKLMYIPSDYIEGLPVNPSIYKEGNIRSLGWESMTALRAFRAALFKKVNKSDLSYQGKFMTVNWDMAFSYPMIEMCASPCSCGDSHYVFIDEVLYHYRINTPINDFRIRNNLQKELDKYIKGLKPYEPLASL